MAGRYANSPGPKYGAKTATGYEGHDPTLPRAPAHSLGAGRRSGSKAATPGAKYHCSGLSHLGGVLRSREAYLQGRPRDLYQRGPSAQSYGAHLCPDVVHARPPTWCLLGRTGHAPRSQGPAPKYVLHDLVGRQAPNFPTAPQYSVLGGSGSSLKKSCSPGPGRYGSVHNDLVFPSSPTPQVLSKHPPPSKQTSPAPKYLPAYSPQSLGFSFGTRHSPQAGLLHTSADRQPFYCF